MLFFPFSCVLTVGLSNFHIVIVNYKKRMLQLNFRESYMIRKNLFKKTSATYLHTYYIVKIIITFFNSSLCTCHFRFKNITNKLGFLLRIPSQEKNKQICSILFFPCEFTSKKRHFCISISVS